MFQVNNIYLLKQRAKRNILVCNGCAKEVKPCNAKMHLQTTYHKLETQKLNKLVRKIDRNNVDVDII